MSEEKSVISAENLPTVAAIAAVAAILSLAFNFFNYTRTSQVVAGFSALEINGARRDADIRKDIDKLKDLEGRLQAIEAKAAAMPAATDASAAAPAEEKK